MVLTEYLVRPATLEDADEMAPNMRESDQAELEACTGHSPKRALRDSIKCTESPLVGVADGEIGCIYGVAVFDTQPYTGVIWLLGTSLIATHSLTFLRHSRNWVREVQGSGKYKYIGNYVHGENQASIDWLRWLGFTIEEAEPYGARRELFHCFHMETEYK